MPAKPTTDFSLTIRFGVPLLELVPMKTVQELLGPLCNKYVIAYEQKGGPSTGHYQCAMVTKEVKRQDKLKATIVRLLKDVMDFTWSKDNEKHAVDVSAHHDVVCLAGGYCHKQDTGIRPIVYGFVDAELVAGQEQYEGILSEKHKKMPVSKSARTGLMKQKYSEVWEVVAGESEKISEWAKKSPEKKVDLMVSLIITDGYDFSECWGPLVRNYYVKHFEEIFEQKTPEKILGDFFSESRI